jgi:hypothetical protein
MVSKVKVMPGLGAAEESQPLRTANRRVVASTAAAAATESAIGSNQW